MTDLFICNLRP